jgi:hypothetical protein
MKKLRDSAQYASPLNQCVMHTHTHVCIYIYKQYFISCKYCYKCIYIYIYIHIVICVCVCVCVVQLLVWIINCARYAVHTPQYCYPYSRTFLMSTYILPSRQSHFIFNICRMQNIKKKTDQLPLNRNLYTKIYSMYGTCSPPRQEDAG